MEVHRAQSVCFRVGKKGVCLSPAHRSCDWRNAHGLANELLPQLQGSIRSSLVLDLRLKNRITKRPDSGKNSSSDDESVCGLATTSSLTEADADLLECISTRMEVEGLWRLMR
nr:unnamed protein product [Haemonchus contortus]